MYSNYNRSNNEKLYSWPMILLALLFLAPFGIFMIFRKQKLHRRNIFTMGNKTLSSGLSVVAFGLLFHLPKIVFRFLNTFHEDVNTSKLKIVVDSKFYSSILNYGSFFIVIGIIVLFIGVYQKFKAKRYHNYISLVVNMEKENLNEIAEKMKLSRDKVIKDLRDMIFRRFLENYEVDVDNNRVFNVIKEKVKKEERLKNTRIVRCPNCYADNLLHEKVGKCQYCNSYIE